MKLKRFVTYVATGLFLAGTVVACGGGGGGGSSTPSTTQPSVSLAASAALLPSGSSVVFSCGCTTQAGTATVGSAGAFTIALSSTATPASPTPTYTIVPGRNYVVVGTAPTQSQVWTVSFVGNTPATNQYLGTTATLDNYTTLAALYLYYNSPAALATATNTTASFSDWNILTVSNWVTLLRNGTQTTTEKQALADIATAQTSNTTLYPQAPGWNPTQSVNSTIANDLTAIAAAGTAADPALPTPCPITNGNTACTGAPSP